MGPDARPSWERDGRDASPVRWPGPVTADFMSGWDAAPLSASVFWRAASRSLERQQNLYFFPLLQGQGA